MKKTRLPARESRKVEEEEWMKKVEQGKQREENEDQETETLTFKQYNLKAVQFLQYGDLRSVKGTLDNYFYI